MKGPLHSLLLLSIAWRVGGLDWAAELDLPPRLLEYKIRNDVTLRKRCLVDPQCPFSEETLKNGRCWGFESGCTFERSYSAEMIKCNLPSKRWKVSDREYQRKRFFEQGDWGYLNYRNTMHSICESRDKEKTRLECSDHLAYCMAENIFFDFRHLNARDSKRYRDDVIHEGDVGGNCDRFYPDAIERQLDRKGYLQSWNDELRHFKSSPEFSVDDDHCDVIFERPTVVIKLDAAINMFHHFCDFINLYASQHINGSTFDDDIDIVWWDTYSGGFIDGFFGATWAAFSRRRPVELVSLDKKRVCFRHAMLPLLARQRYGMYYNLPLIDGCQGSGLMHAFSHHVIHRLRIEQKGPLPEKVRITFLSRSTPHRRVLNVDKLMARLEKMPGVSAKIVDYNRKVPFLDQLEQTHNTDIFIGIHGSGLTHLLFLPDWAAVFEIYNCGDEFCYLDLARLRGVRYQTWTNEALLKSHGEVKHPNLGTSHPKFADYTFDIDEFERIVKELIEYVRRHPLFRESRRKLRKKQQLPTKSEL